MKVVSIPKWYPTVENPNKGIFFKIQNELLNNKINVSVLYVEITTIKSFMKKVLYKNKLIDNKLSYARFLTIPRPIPGMKVLNNYIHYKGTEYLYKQYMKTNGKADIFHAHVSLGAGQTAIKLGEKYNVPVVITEHHSQVIGNEKIIKEINKLVKKADQFVCVSNFLKNNIGNSEIKVIPNFIKDTEEKNMTVAKDFMIVTTTSMTPNKNTILLLQALELFRNEKVKLIVIGNGPEYNNLFNFSKINHLDVSFIGPVNNEKAKEIISQASLYVSTSKVETFGVSILEAISLGVPVITTDSRGPRDIINKTNGIILKTFTKKELYINIKKVKDQDINFKKEEILKDYYTRLSSDIGISKYIDLYEGMKEDYNQK